MVTDSEIEKEKRQRMSMPAPRRGLWMAVMAGLLGSHLPTVEAQGLQPHAVQARQQGNGAQTGVPTGQATNPEQRAKEQAASRPLLGKPSQKAQRPAQSQNVLPKWPFNQPFRYFNPIQRAEPKPGIVRLLRRLDYARALYIRSKKRGTDVHGRPSIQNKEFTETIAAIQPQLRNMQAYFLYLMRDHAKITYRRAAHFGCLYIPDMRQVFEAISYAPCDPDRDTRQYAMLMGAPILRKYLPQRGPEGKPVTVDLDSKGPKPPYTWPFDSDPYLNLLRAPAIEERLYGLSFLRIFAATRPDQAAEQIRRMDRFFLDGLVSPNKDIAKVTRFVINDLAIATRSITGIQDDCPKKPEEATAFFHKLMHKLFPDIRIRGGLVDLYEGAELRQVLDKLETLCKENKLGFRDSQKIGTKGSQRLARGIRLRDYPVLKKIGLEAGLLVTAINGSPVLDPKEIPKLVGLLWKARQHAFALTFIDDKGQERVLQYRYKPKQ